MSSKIAPGAPGIEPRWTTSAKEGIGTAYHTSSQVWYTVSHGIINEIYFPHVDSPNTRDLQFLITDGESFCHEERRDLIHQVERPEPDALLFRLTNTDRAGRYRLVKEVLGEPHSSVVLMHVRLEILDEALTDKLKLYVLLAPHIKNTGEHNFAGCKHIGGYHLLCAERDEIHLALGCNCDFTKRSVGYVGTSDGWRDLMDNFQMDWQYHIARDGNVALMGEVDLSQGNEFTVGVGMGFSCQSAATQLLQSFVFPFDVSRQKFIEQWKRTNKPNGVTLDNPATHDLFRLSKCVLQAHEDKTFLGASVASMSIPWGETQDDDNRGGYHLVWARDMVHTATALLACREHESPLRALIWLSCVQAEDGGMPQNSEIDGTPYWHGVQLDEIAAPILLAWRLKRADALQDFDPWIIIRRAVRFLILNGPVTAQERWEENSGYSPSTLAATIAAVICAADFADDCHHEDSSSFLRDYADWLVANLESWTVTTCGELVPGKPRHYVRITPEDPCPGSVAANPNTAVVEIKNGGGSHPARNVVDAGFLDLVRLGIRAADDPVIVDSVAVVDAVLKRDLPQGPCWRRYNHDGYGQYPDGSAFDGAGEGRSWPLLTGERGHYELAAGRDPIPLVKAIEGFANEGGMLSEQLWDSHDLPDGSMKFGQPSGAAMPLCWAHAEYICLVRSAHDGVCFDRIEPVYQRYAVNNTPSEFEIWTFAHQIQELPTGKKLRIISDRPALVHWSEDNWQTQKDVRTRRNALNLYYADLPLEQHEPGTKIIFTLLWTADDKWEGTDYVITIA